MTGRAALGPRVPTYVLRAEPFSPVAHVAQVALAARGRTWIEQVAPEGVRAVLTIRGPAGRRLAVEEPMAMLDAIEARHPEAPLLPREPEARRAARRRAALGLDLRLRLSAVTRSTESNEHDMAVHTLRAALTRLELALPRVTPEGPLDFAEAALAPPLWRMRVLDRHHSTYLIADLPRTAALAARLAEHPHVRLALGPEPEARYNALLARRGAVLVAAADAASWRLLVGHGRPLHGAG